MPDDNATSRGLERLGLNTTMLHVLNALQDGVVVVSRDTTVVFSNPAFSSMLGMTRERLHQQKLLRILPGSLVEKALQTQRDVNSTPEDTRHSLEGSVCSVLLLPRGNNVQGALALFMARDRPLGDQATVRCVQAFLDSRLSRETSLPDPFARLIGEDPTFRQALFLAYKAGQGDFPALVTGESGVGKELLVRAIHQSSSRHRHDFVPINCATIPNTLIESELFGYESGTFTGARRQGKKGLFDQAHQGTLFFDEIGDLEMGTQAKILRVLEEKTFRRVGGEKLIRADVRLLSATNKSLEQMVLDGRFREDLFYRLNTMIIRLPPLRERGNDLRLLAAHLLEAFCRHYRKAARLSQDALDILAKHDWPGNVRELRSVIEYAVNMADTATINPTDLPHYLLLSDTKASLEGKLSPPGGNTSARQPLYKEMMNAFERELLQAVMNKCTTRTQAMNMLGLSRRAFYQKLQRQGILS
jgi:transcriptional regulator with PAS, ATPase and Fis domain